MNEMHTLFYSFISRNQASFLAYTDNSHSNVSIRLESHVRDRMTPFAPFYSILCLSLMQITNIQATSNFQSIFL